MAQTHLQQVLTASGLPEDQVKALLDLPEDAKDFKTDTYIAPIHTTIEGKVKNDPKFYEGLNRDNLPKEFLKTLEAEQYGRSAAQVRTNMLKATGLSEKDFADLGEEGKKIDVFTPAFVKKLSEGKVGDKELQAALVEANKKLQELETSVPAIEEKYKGEYDKKIVDYQFSAGVLTQLASVTGLKAPAKYLAADLTNQLKSKYGFVIGDNGTVELRQKDKPTLKVLTDNGTKELTLAGAITQILESEDLIDKKAAKVEATKTKIETGDGGLKVSKNVNDKMQKRIAEEKAASGAA